MRKAGFTTIELVMVIMLIGVLAVYATSRLGGREGFSESVYQARLVSILRNMQTRAMFDTRSGFCFQVNFNQGTGAFGPPSLDYSTGNEAATCATSINETLPFNNFVTQAELTQEGLSISASESGFGIDFLQFNSLGKPVGGAANCFFGCTVDFLRSGQTVGTVCIEAEGYIHEGSCG